MTDQFRLHWPVDRRVVTQFFGLNPDFYAPFGLPGHEGLDVFAPMEANVYAAAGGEVYRVDHPPDHPYGLHVRIRHEVGDKVYRTVYAHLARAFVSEEQQVRTGERIGLADNTGNSFGSHLHLTLKIDGVQTPGYPPGIVDPWPFFKATTEELPPTSDLIVYPVDLLSLRAEPTIHSTRLSVLNEGEPLTVLGDVETAKARIGKEGEWIRVQTESGSNGFVAAWYVRLTGQSAPVSSLRLQPTHLLNVRARPFVTANHLTTVTPDDVLVVLGDPVKARARIGEEGQWLNVRTPSGHVGYIAAWFVRVEDATVPVSLPPSAIPTMIVYPVADLNLRAQPTTNSPRVGGAFFNRPLVVLEDNLIAARAKIGHEGQWLFVETETGERGWAAAWFLSLSQA